MREKAISCSAYDFHVVFWGMQSVSFVNLKRKTQHTVVLLDVINDPRASIQEVHCVRENNSTCDFVILSKTLLQPVWLPVIVAGTADAGAQPSDHVVLTVASTSGCHRSGLYSQKNTLHGIVQVAVGCDGGVYLLQVDIGLTGGAIRPSALQLATPEFFEQLPSCASFPNVDVHQKGASIAGKTCAARSWSAIVRPGSNPVFFRGRGDFVLSDSVLSHSEIISANITVLNDQLVAQAVDGLLISQVSSWAEDWQSKLPQVVPVGIIAGEHSSAASCAGLDVQSGENETFHLQVAVGYSSSSKIRVFLLSNAKRDGLFGRTFWTSRQTATIQHSQQSFPAAISLESGRLYASAPEAPLAGLNSTGSVHLSFTCGDDEYLGRQSGSFECLTCPAGQFRDAGPILNSACYSCAESRPVALPPTALWTGVGCSWACRYAYFGESCQFCHGSDLNAIIVHNVTRCTEFETSSQICLEWSLHGVSSSAMFNTSAAIVGLGSTQTVHSVNAIGPSLAKQRFRSILRGLQPNSFYTVTVSASRGDCTGLHTKTLRFRTKPREPCPWNPVTSEICSGAGICIASTGECDCTKRTGADNEIQHNGKGCNAAAGLIAVAEFIVPEGVYGFDVMQVARRLSQTLADDEFSSSGGFIGNRVAARNLPPATETSPRNTLGLMIVINFRGDELQACSDSSISRNECYGQLVDIWNAPSLNVGQEASTLSVIRHLFTASTASHELLRHYGLTKILAGIASAPDLEFPVPLESPLTLAQWNAMGLPGQVNALQVLSCSSFNSCANCLRNDKCGWCATSRACQSATVNGPHPYLPGQCPQNSLYQSQRTSLHTCPAACSLEKNCDVCSSRAECGWCDSTKTCLHFNDQSCPAAKFRKSLSQCAQGRCRSLINFNQCVSDEECAWCADDTPGCLELSSLQCSGNLSALVDHSFITCNLAATTCEECTKQPGCLWCPEQRKCSVSAGTNPQPRCEALNMKVPAAANTLSGHIYNSETAVLSGGYFPASNTTGIFPQCFPSSEQVCAIQATCGRCSATPGCMWCADTEIAHTGIGDCMDTASALHKCPMKNPTAAIFYKQCPHTCVGENAIMTNGGISTVILSTDKTELSVGTELQSSSSVLTQSGVNRCRWRVGASHDQVKIASLASGEFKSRFVVRVNAFLAHPSVELAFFPFEETDRSSPLLIVKAANHDSACFTQLLENRPTFSMADLASNGDIEAVQCSLVSQEYLFFTSSRAVDVSWRLRGEALKNKNRLQPLVSKLSVSITSSLVPNTPNSGNTADSLTLALALTFGTGLLLLTAVVVMRRQRTVTGAGGDSGDIQVPAKVLAALVVFSLPKHVPLGWEMELFGTSNTECSICFDAASPGDSEEYRALNCGHIFHKKCVDTWFKQRNTCPMCRAQVSLPRAAGSKALPTWIILAEADAPLRRVKVCRNSGGPQRTETFSLGPPRGSATAEGTSSIGTGLGTGPASTNSFEYVSPLFHRSSRS